MADVFLSYARADRPQAEDLADKLEAAGYSVWWDRHIDGGSEFSAEIERQLEAAGAVLVLWSADSVQSRWVRDEASIGLEAGKLVSATIDRTAPPIGFKQIHSIDLTEAAGHGDLLRALGHRLGGLEVGQTPLAAPAKKPRTTILAAALGAVLLAALAGWWMLGRDAGEAQSTQQERVAAVAVLPFRSLSGDEADRYFAEGVSEEILNRLGALSELRVTARSSSFQFGETDLAANEVAEQLGVSHLVEGTVRREGEKWRVTAQLIEAQSASQLWSDTYDASGDDILEVQTEISERAAEALGVLLSEDKRARMAEVGIDNPEAFALFARGLDRFAEAHNKGATFENLEEANALFDRAFALEPRFWNAQIAAVDRYSHLLTDHSIGFDVGGPEVAAEAQQEILRRLEVARSAAPRLAHPVIDQQIVQFSDDWSDARQVIERMLSDEQACAVVTSYNDWLVIRMGLVDEYIDYAKRLQQCDPLSSKVPLAATLLYADRTQEAIELIEASGDNSEAMMRIHVLALLKAGRPDDAEDVFDRMDPKAYYKSQAETWIYAARGDREALQAHYDKYVATGAPDVALLHVATLMGEQELANSLAAKIDARPAGPIWFGNSGMVTCHCGNGFDIEATPRFKARLEAAGASLDLPSPIDWPLQR